MLQCTRLFVPPASRLFEVREGAVPAASRPLQVFSALIRLVVVVMMECTAMRSNKWDMIGLELQRQVRMAMQSVQRVDSNVLALRTRIVASCLQLQGQRHKTPA